MKQCILYVKLNHQTEEMFACGLIYIINEHKYLFKWSKKKISAALRVNGLSKHKTLRQLIELEFRNIVRNSKAKKPLSIINYLNYKIMHGTGLITVGDIKPFVLIPNKTVQEDMDLSFRTKIEK